MRSIRVALLLCALPGLVAADSIVTIPVSHYCGSAPDQVRPPIYLYTQQQLPPGYASAVPRSAPSFHTVTQSPAHFSNAPPPPGVQLVHFCPPGVRLATCAPPSVATFRIHTPAPHWISVPPRPAIHIATTVEHPPYHGPPFQRQNVSLVHRPPPECPACSPHCLPR
ncbi:MAG: hypothetical protein RMJ19_07370 [Gemmatales bacterium]|nr:hypothetical protein [Gemmatales bacterium]MDW8175475.1 hypothetical protein [Gemmatales bacterium]MDW8222095.1 hypothetical protein [Gemmatales bacterium]